MIERQIIFVLVCLLLALLHDRISNARDRRRKEQLQEDIEGFTVMNGSMEPQPWRTGVYKVKVVKGVNVIYTEWARFEGGDGFNDVLIVKCFKKATPEEVADYMDRYGERG